MAEITAASVKELRERTGAGMMDCKKALGETAGDMEAAIDWLRTKGLAAAAKKAGRTAAEGLVGVAVDGNKGAIVEVNSETDFVAKNEQFQDFVRTAAAITLGTGSDIEALKEACWPGGGTVEEKLTSNIATIGENQAIRRAALLEVERGRDRLLRPQCGGPGPRQDRRAGRARERRRARRARGARQAARHAHRRGQPAGAARRGARSRRCSSASARSPAKRPPRAASRPRSSRRWSRARWPSSARRMRCSRSSSSSTTRPRSRTSSPPRRRRLGAPVALKAYVRFQLGEGIEKKDQRLRRRSRRRRRGTAEGRAVA